MLLSVVVGSEDGRWDLERDRVAFARSFALSMIVLKVASRRLFTDTMYFFVASPHLYSLKAVSRTEALPVSALKTGLRAMARPLALLASTLSIVMISSAQRVKARSTWTQWWLNEILT
jgi:hypothetical protein